MFHMQVLGELLALEYRNYRGQYFCDFCEFHSDHKKFLLQNFLDHSLDLTLQNYKKPMNHKNLARSQIKVKDHRSLESYSTYCTWTIN